MDHQPTSTEDSKQNEPPSAEFEYLRQDPNKPDIIDARYLISFEHMLAGFVFLLEAMFKLGVEKKKEVFKIVIQLFNSWYNRYPEWLSESCHIGHTLECGCNYPHPACIICYESVCEVGHRCWQKFYPLLRGQEQSRGEGRIVYRLFERQLITADAYDRFFRIKHMLRQNDTPFRSYANLLEVMDLRHYQWNLLTLMRNTGGMDCRKLIVVVDRLGNNGKTFLNKLLALTQDIASLSVSDRQYNFSLLKKQSESPQWLVFDIRRSEVATPSDELFAYQTIEDLTSGVVSNNRGGLLYMDISNTGAIIQSNKILTSSCFACDKLTYQVDITSIIKATKKELSQDIYTFVERHRIMAKPLVEED